MAESSRQKVQESWNCTVCSFQEPNQTAHLSGFENSPCSWCYSQRGQTGQRRRSWHELGWRSALPRPCGLRSWLSSSAWSTRQSLWSQSRQQKWVFGCDPRFYSSSRLQQVFNPFPVPTCKAVGLESPQTRLQTVYFLVLCQRTVLLILWVLTGTLSDAKARMKTDVRILKFCIFIVHFQVTLWQWKGLSWGGHSGPQVPIRAEVSVDVTQHWNKRHT